MSKIYRFPFSLDEYIPERHLIETDLHKEASVIGTWLNDNGEVVVDAFVHLNPDDEDSSTIMQYNRNGRYLSDERTSWYDLYIVDGYYVEELNEKYSEGDFVVFGRSNICILKKIGRSWIDCYAILYTNPDSLECDSDNIREYNFPVRFANKDEVKKMNDMLYAKGLKYDNEKKSLISIKQKVEIMKYKQGDKVRIRNKEWFVDNIKSSNEIINKMLNDVFNDIYGKEYVIKQASNGFYTLEGLHDIMFNAEMFESNDVKYSSLMEGNSLSLGIHTICVRDARGIFTEYIEKGIENNVYISVDVKNIIDNKTISCIEQKGLKKCFFKWNPNGYWNELY
jgi:hypothetical protein